ncbi:sterol carrier protein domain-containing protein, partial [Desulfovibrio sp. 1188_IL3213]|uniref:sterol carrier protein domain-containing protein n=1 Tax=Desulfovibrio sp. 1188_IL3213 TaxID=3084052 RepID=UPI002FD9837F
MKQNFQPEEGTQGMAQHTTRKKAGAGRKVDVQRFMEFYPYQFSDPRLTLDFEVRDPIAPWNNGIFHMSWQ